MDRIKVIPLVYDALPKGHFEAVFARQIWPTITHMIRNEFDGTYQNPAFGHTTFHILFHSQLAFFMFLHQWMIIKKICTFIVLINSWESKIIRSWTEEADSMNNVQALSNLNYFSWSIISNIEGNEMKWNYSLDVARNDGEGRRTCHWNQGYSDLKRRHCFRW